MADAEKPTPWYKSRPYRIIRIVVLVLVLCGLAAAVKYRITWMKRRAAMAPSAANRVAWRQAAEAQAAGSKWPMLQGAPARFEPNKGQLDQLHAWFRQNPPTGENRAERRQRAAILQTASDQLSVPVWEEYLSRWRTNPTRSGNTLDNYPVLYYMRKAMDQAVEDIKTTRVEEGLALWFMYNMGYVFKTPDACFGIDLRFPAAERLTEELDFLLVTHEHADHYWQPLMDAMIQANKPVVTRSYGNTSVVTSPTELQFGPVRVKVDIGDHDRNKPDQTNNMLMFQVDCGEASGDCTIYHSGDANNYEKMQPDREVDIFIPHVAVGMSVPAAVGHLKPRMTLASHVLELGHEQGPTRISLDRAFQVIEGLPPAEAAILTWGERRLAPGTVLEGQAPLKSEEPDEADEQTHPTP